MLHNLYLYLTKMVLVSQNQHFPNIKLIYMLMSGVCFKYFNKFKSEKGFTWFHSCGLTIVCEGYQAIVNSYIYYAPQRNCLNCSLLLPNLMSHLKPDNISLLELFLSALLVIIQINKLFKIHN